MHERWCRDVKEALCLELRKICLIAQVAEQIPGTAMRAGVLSELMEEAGEASFWNTVYCSCCDYECGQNPGYSPGYGPYGPGCPPGCDPYGPGCPPGGAPYGPGCPPDCDLHGSGSYDVKEAENKNEDEKKSE